MKFDETICAPATPVGTGAITVIRVSGPDTFAIADRVIKFRNGSSRDADGYTIKYGTVLKADGEVLDEVLVSIFKAPHSYTGEDGIEISCHASSYVAQSIMFQLVEAGCRTALPGEFTQRAFVNGKMDLAQAEAVADLIASQNEAAHRIAINQLRGGFSDELGEMRSSLLDLTSLMELELDFSEEDVEFADRTKLNALLEVTLAHIHRLTESFRLGNAIRNGVPVAIVGAANTGKSTLLNALVGEDRAIVSDIAGTTRDTVEETVVVDGTMFRFIDTAGIRDTEESIEKIGIERTFRKIAEADIVLGVVSEDTVSGFAADGGSDECCLGDGVRSNDGFAAESIDCFEGTFADEAGGSGACDDNFAEAAGSQVRRILDAVDLEAQKVIIIVNKCDICRDNNFVNTINKIVSSAEYKSSDVSVLNISAKNGLGLDKLRELLSDIQKGRVSASNSTLVSNARHFEALTLAANSLEAVRTGLASGIPTDLVAQDLREALYHLGTITGEISTDEVLGNIFKKFCIGK